MKRYLVTGGAGFIGSHIVEALVKRGGKVRVLDSLITSSRSNLEAVSGKIQFIKGDVRNPRDLKRALADVDVVFHEAALRSVPRSVDDPFSTNEVNVTGTLQLLAAAREAKVKRVIFASSSSVYGDNRDFPQGEGIRPSPLSPYAASKCAGEMYCGVYAKTFGLETVSLRYFNVFGPRQRPDSQYAAVIPKFMKAALEGTRVDIHWDGKQSRDFTYVENVAEANIRAAEATHVSGGYFNIACGESHSLLEILHYLEKFVGRKLVRHHLPRRAGDIRRTWADTRKAERILHFKPRVGFEDGLRQTWEWFVASQAQKKR